MALISQRRKTAAATLALLLMQAAHGAETAAAPAHQNSARAAAPLDAIRVQGQGPDQGAAPLDAYGALRRIPGHVSLIPAARYQEGAVHGLRDALSRTPGIYVQNPSGQESARVSIRGSGISATSGLRGIRLLRDGLPLGRADDLGDTIYADPFNASRIEVYRGANSLQYGAATLGGAINLVSPTGYTQARPELRVEGGSYGYQKAQLRAGQVFDNGLDAFASLSRFHADGFRDQSAQTISRFYGNVGYRHNQDSIGRLHVTAEQYRVEMPGALTLDQAHTTPKAANPGALRANARIKTSPRWHVAYQHDWTLGQADTLSLGVFHTGTEFSSHSALSRIRYDAADSGMALRHEIKRKLSGHENRFVWGANYARGTSHNRAFTPDYLPVPDMALATVDARRASLDIFMENTFGVTSDFFVVTGMQVSRAWRATDNKALTPLGMGSYAAAGGDSVRYQGVSPKLGFIWDAGRNNAQLYANISRSFEAPNSLAFHTQAGPLQVQRATTLELGTRGGDDALGWDAALYTSQVKHELIEMPIPGNPFAPPLTANADKTRHTGLELGLRGKWPLSDSPGHISWGLAYTWNHFRFVRDTTYGNRKLPSIPPHIARLDLLYEHPGGFYGGPNIELASGWQVDQANSLQAPGYGVINFTAGYREPGGRYRVFVDARNLANKYYAATSDYIVDARAPGQTPYLFYPGRTRAVFMGLEMAW